MAKVRIRQVSWIPSACMCKLYAYLLPLDSRDLAGATVPQDGSTDTGNEIDYKHPEGNSDDDVQNLPRDGAATMEQPTTSQDTKPDSEKSLYALVWPWYNPNCKDKGEGKPGIPIDNGDEPEELGSGGGSSL